MFQSKLVPFLPAGPWRLLVLALLLAGCSDSGTFTPVDNAPLQLTLTPSDLVMNNHDTVQMEVGQRLPDGRVVPFDAALEWTSSSPAVANVNGTGLLHARLPGEVTVKATSRRGEVSTRVTILPVSADLSLEVTDHLRVEAGSAEPVALRARIVDSTGRPVPGVRVDFSVDGSSVSMHPTSAPTGPDGYALTQVHAGETAREFDLLISSPGLEGSASGAAGPGSGGPAASSTPPGQLRKEARLEVGPSHPASLEVIPGDALMATGENRTFAAIIRDEFGNTIESDDVRWKTRDSGVAVVSSEGRVTAVAPGATEVTAEYKEGRHHVEGAAPTTVEAVAVSGPAKLTLVSGSGQSAPVRDDIDGLTIQVLDEVGRPVQGVTAKWRVQSGSGTMVVSATSTDGDGLSSNTFIAGTEAGPVTVRAEVEGLAAVSFDLTVEPGAAYLLEVSPSSVNLDVGETQTLSVTAQDRHGNVIPDPQPSWASSNVKVVTVDDSGRMTAKDGGTAAVQAVLDLAEAETAVEVKTTQSEPGPDPQPEPGDEEHGEAVSLHISAPRTSLTSLGETLQLEVEARDEEGSVVSSPSATWTSSDNDVASVNSSGRVIANAIGTAVISVAAACCSGDQISISVTQEVASVHVSPSSASMEPGTTRQFSAEAQDANGNPITGVEFDWSSTQQTVASVSSNGVVSAHSDGSTGIRATASNRTVEAPVTVSSADDGATPHQSWPNRPSGMTTVTDHDWSQESPWRVFSNKDPETEGSLTTVPDGSAPRGTGPNVLRGLYREGFGDGDEPGRASFVMQDRPSEIYWGAWVKVDPHFVNHQFQLKWHFFWMDDNAGSLWVDWRHRFEENTSNSSAYEESNIRFRFQGPQWNIPQLQEQNVQPQLVTFPRGDWVRLEVHLRRGDLGQANGTARLWQNGVLIVDLDNIEYPSNFGYVTHAGTYGGGPQQAPHDQAWYVARTHLSVR